jgi:transposase
MSEVSTIGLDLAKTVFQVHGVDQAGDVVISRQLRRHRVLPFFKKLAPCLIGLEACASSHHWARELTALGHEVRIMPVELRRRAICVGIVAAIVLRNMFATVTFHLLAVVGLTLAGSLLLLWGCWKMWREIRSGQMTAPVNDASNVSNNPAEPPETQ